MEVERRQSQRLRQRATASKGSPAASSSTSLKTEPEPMKISCCVCLEDLPFCKMVDFGCHMNTCRDCGKRYLEGKIEEGDVQRLVCPDPGCGKEVAQGTVAELVSLAAFQRLQVLQLKALDLPEIAHCPKPSCGQLVQVVTAEYGLCEPCDFKFCTKCNGEFHDSRPCRSEEEGSKDKASEDLIKQVCKKCPTCSAQIEKTAGCNTMQCSRCKTYFCWLCCYKLNSANGADPHQDPHFTNTATVGQCQLFEDVEDDDEYDDEDEDDFDDLDDDDDMDEEGGEDDEDGMGPDVCNESCNCSFCGEEIGPEQMEDVEGEGEGEDMEEEEEEDECEEFQDESGRHEEELMGEEEEDAEDEEVYDEDAADDDSEEADYGEDEDEHHHDEVEEEEQVNDGDEHVEEEEEEDYGVQGQEDCEVEEDEEEGYSDDYGDHNDGGDDDDDDDESYY